MRFIHFTDLHHNHESPFQRELILQLLVDLDAERAKGAKFDFIVFSGDLVENPDAKDSYYHFERDFLEPVLGTCDIKPSRLVMCPGNHDVSWASQKKQHLQYDWVQNNRRDQNFLTKEARGDDLKNYARSISKGFFDLTSRFGGNWENPFFHIYSFDDIGVSFVAINTAYTCSLDGSEADRGHIALSAELALGALHDVPNSHKIVSLAHHTFGDLTEATTASLIPTVEKYSTLHCFGHVHQAKPGTHASTSGVCFYNQGGALYEKQGRYNGYAIIRAAESMLHIESRFRSYYVDRHEFDDGTNVSHTGSFFNSPAAESHFKHAIPAPAQDEICKFLLESYETVSTELNETIADRRLDDTFVEPVIIKPAQGSDEATQKSNTSITINDILNGTEHIVIGTDKEYGSTSLLKYLTIQFFQRCAGLENARVPLLIDARKLKPYEASITGALRAQIPESDNRSLKLQSLHENSRLVVLIDEFNGADERHVLGLKQLRKSYPNLRIIVAAKLPIPTAEHILPLVGIDEFTYVQMKTLNRGRVRRLVQKWRDPSDGSTDQLVEEIISRFRALGILLTAPYVTIYLSILQNNKSFSPINTSTVIENFVEGVLEKYKPEYSFRSAFDYRDQVDYLSVVAENMSRSNTYIVEFETLYAWTKEHFEYTGIEQNYQNVIDFFVLNKVFDLDGNAVLFRYNIFLSFFIATRMRNSSEFRDWVFSEKRYLQHIAEIDIYCGLTRNDENALEFLASEFRHYAERMAELVAPLAWVEPLENLKLPFPSEKVDATDLITKQLTTPNMSDEKRDAELDKEDGKTSVKPLIKRAEVEGTLGPWVMSLRAYTVALKNLESISKIKKEEHLQQVLEGWATVLRYACLLFDMLIEDREIDVGPMHFRLNLPKHIRAGLLRSLFVTIPLMISHIVRKDLGSQKLALPLKNEALAKSVTVAFLQTGLYADMKLPGYIEQLKKLHERVKGSNLFLEVLLQKMRDIYVRYNVATNEEDAFRDLAMEVSADAKGLKGKARTEHKHKFAGDLRRQDLVTKIKNNVGG